MPIQPVLGMPRIGSTQRAKFRKVFREADWSSVLPGGKIIDGTKTRDSGNGATPQYCRAGLLMGKVTASSKYANSIVGVFTGAYTSGGTTITVSPAQAVEIVRRVGSSGAGTLIAAGPPSAGGTMAFTAVTFSAVNTSSGDITVTSLGVNKIAGTFLTTNDGSETPITFLPDGYPRQVVDATGVSQDQSYPDLPVAGIVDPANLVDWPSDTSLRTFIRTSLSTLVGGKYVFSDQF